MADRTSPVTVCSLRQLRMSGLAFLLAAWLLPLGHADAHSECEGKAREHHPSPPKRDDEEAPKDEGDAEDDDAPEDGEKKSGSENEEGEPEGDADDAKKKEEEKKKPVIRRVRPNRHITIRARSVKLESESRLRLLEIAKRYHQATRRKLVITGGDRTPHRQAELMYRKLAKGQNLLKLYRKVQLVLELTRIYEKGKKANFSRRTIIGKMGKAIAKQVKRGEYVSRHLAYTAADVRSRGLKDEHVEALRAAVSAVKGARLVDERKSDAPHFHLSL